MIILNNKRHINNTTTSTTSAKKHFKVGFGSIMLQNYFTKNSSTKYRRYERDRQTTSAQANGNPQQSMNYSTLNHYQILSRTYVHEVTHNDANQIGFQSNPTQLHTKINLLQRHEESDITSSARMRPKKAPTRLGANNVAYKPFNFVEYKNINKYSKNTSIRFCNNIKQYIVLTITIISLANIAYEGRILCDKISPLQTVGNGNQIDASPKLTPYRLQPDRNSPNDPSTSKRSHLMELLTAFMKKRKLDYGSESKLPNEAQHSITANYKDYEHFPSTSNRIRDIYQRNNIEIPVTSTPSTATLILPNMIQSVTPPSLFAHNRSILYSGIRENAMPSSSIATHTLQSDTLPLLPEFKPSLVYSINDIVDARIRSSPEKNNLVTPLVHILPIFDHMIASGSSPPVVVARNSNSPSALSPINLSSNRYSKQSQTYSRRMRSLLDKNQSHSTLTNTKAARPRGVMWEMATDTTLLVTLFHMLDRASFALPLGFLLMPIIQMVKNPAGRGLGLGNLLPPRATHRSVDYEELVKRIDYVDKLLSKALRPSHRSEMMGVIG